ncbi:hypothetical protein C4D60_Mb04t38450 [Musa balbisiana]|uniref:F-box domain-containing protein n=1 Tax=Musa balbisiana TaxID=52838 RepID=A0A4S8KHT4_MUSBA|nr:hypothetical protein C4D60_Mb04t38450 [Musa balbisiana]
MDVGSPKRGKIHKGKSVADEGTAMSQQAINDRQWENLPTNCLVDIFQKLSLHDLTLGVPFVCKSWYEASLDPSCWKILDFRTIDPRPGSEFTEKFKHEYRLDRYQFRGFLNFLIRRSCKLAILLIHPPSQRIPINDLVYILKECPKLDIYNPPLSVKNPGLMRKFILTVHETILRRASYEFM